MKLVNEDTGEEVSQLRQCVNCQVSIDEYAPDLILCGACEDELFGEAG